MIAPLAEFIITALNQQFLLIHQALRQLLPGGSVDRLNRGACHVHLQGAFSLAQLFQIDQTDRFILV